MSFELMFMPRDAPVPRYLAEAPTGSPDAGATSVEYALMLETAPVGSQDVIGITRRVAASLRGEAKVQIEALADERVVDTLVAYVQTTEPVAPNDGEFWLDVGQSPDELKKRVNGSWRLIPDASRSDRQERELELPVKTRARVNALRVTSLGLVGDLTVGSWAIGVRPIKRRE